MNKFPAWLNALVLAILLAGCLFALPNIYGSVDAIQIADNDGVAYEQPRLEEFVRTVENAGVTPEAVYLQDGRVVLRFNTTEEQEAAGERLRAAYSREANIAATLAPKLPKWVRDLGLKPMSLGLDLRGGVYVLLEVDMETAVDSRMVGYQQSFDESLRDAKIRHRVDLNAQTITVRVTGAEDLEAARDVIRRLDQDVLISDGTDGKSLNVRMSEAQIQARQDFAIEQNITTLRNRVNDLVTRGNHVTLQDLRRYATPALGTA
jgi:preprotein translocase subunit SecD